MEDGRKEIKNKFLFLNQSGQMDSRIHQTIILQEVQKTWSVSHFRIIQSWYESKSQSLGLKQQSYFEYKATTCCSNLTVSMLDWAISSYIGWYTCWQDSRTPIFIVHKEGRYIAFITFLVWSNYMVFPFHCPSSRLSNLFG